MTSNSTYIKKSLRDPFILALALMALLPLFYRSPDGLRVYLLDRWSPSYSVFLFFWISACLAAILCWRTRAFKTILLVTAANILLCYIILVLFTGFLWAKKRWEFVHGYGHHINDAELMLKHRPNYHWRGMPTGAAYFFADTFGEGKEFSIDLDEEGFRNPSPVPEKIDIAFLGDSATFAAQVPHETLYTTLAARDLNLVGRNYGIVGIGQGTELGVLKHYILPKHPRVIVIQFYDNDPADNLWYFTWKTSEKSRMYQENWVVGRDRAGENYPFWQVLTLRLSREMLTKAFFHISERSTGFLVKTPCRTVHTYHHPLPDAYNTLQFLEISPAMAEALARYTGSVNDHQQVAQWVQQVMSSFYPSALYSPAEWNSLCMRVYIESRRFYATRELFREILDVCKIHHCKALVVHVPTAWLVYRKHMTPIAGTPPQVAQFANRDWPGLHNMDQLLGAAVRAQGARYVSLLEKWQNPPDYYYLRYDTHLNTQGHRALADIIDSEVRGLLKEEKNVVPSLLPQRR